MPTLLFFGATWCPACNDNFILFDQLRSQFAYDKLQLIFIAIREDEKTINDFANQNNLDCDILLDYDGFVASKYKIKRIPTAILINKKGKVIFRGYPDEKIISDRLLGISTQTQPKKKAKSRFKQKTTRVPKGKKRMIVAFDESPKLSKKLARNIINRRNQDYLNIIKKHGGRIVHNYGKLQNCMVVEIPEEKLQALNELPNLKDIQEDKEVSLLLEDSVYQINADYSWSNGITGNGVRVCVIDTGIDVDHPDLQNKVVAQFDAATGDTVQFDDNSHGTHVAGIVASEGINYRGVAFDAELMAAKVLDATGNGFASDVILGINWCVDNGADVINMSLGEGQFTGTCDSEPMAQAVNAAVDAGVVVVCAAGNDGTPNDLVSPACASKVIAVGALDKADFIASYSDGGAELDLVAPGGDSVGGTNYPEIVSTFSTLVANDPFLCLYFLINQCFDDQFIVDGNRYIRAVGTSMACPHVAGAAALILSENPTLSPAQVKQVLEENADDLGPPGWDGVYGWGKINLERTIDNLPAEVSELSVSVTEPNVSVDQFVGQPFDLTAQVNCFGGDGCGQVSVLAEACQGIDCDNYTSLGPVHLLSTQDDNPTTLGNLSGVTVDTDAPILFDAQTSLELATTTYSKTLSPTVSFVGSTATTQFNTGDLEPGDALGAIEENVFALYQFDLPPGVIQQISIRMEHYLVIQSTAPPSLWNIFTSNSNADELNLVDSCIPDEGGGGLPEPPDCWFTTTSPVVLADFNPGGTNYIKLISSNVGEFDWLTFNDIEVIVDYQINPANDDQFAYTMQMDLSSINSEFEVTSARLNLELTQSSPGCEADLFLIDNAMQSSDSPQTLHEPGDPNYTNLLNPVKSFSCQSNGQVSLNLKAAVEDALQTNQDKITFQIRERNNDQQFQVNASGNTNAPTLTISQKDNTQQAVPINPNDPNLPMDQLLIPAYDTKAIRDISSNSFTKLDSPASVEVGSPVALQFNTGDLEPQDAIGAIEQDVFSIYSFELPPGVVSQISIRMEHYLVIQSTAPSSGWFIYTSDQIGSENNLIGDCIPGEGGGGLPEPPDCWWTSQNPAVLSDLNPGGTSYIKLLSHDVGVFDWLTFNDIEVIVDYQIDPNNDEVSRYYLKFDISSLTPDAEIDSALLNLTVTNTDPEAVAEVQLVDSNYESLTGALTIYDADPASYSNLINPIKTFSANTAGKKQNNVRAALEDAVESGEDYIAFLINEQFENQLFTIDGSNGANPPELEIFLKSQFNSGTAQWKVNPSSDGTYSIRLTASGTTMVDDKSDTIVIQVIDPNKPVINNIDCMINSNWVDCQAAGFGDTIQQIRVDATDPQQVPGINIKLENIPDNQTWINASASHVGGSTFTYPANLIIQDSGDWQLTVTATDVDSNQATQDLTWLVPWGTLTSTLVSPVSNINVPKGESFMVTTQVECQSGECDDVQASLLLNDPVELIYDDGGAEDFGDIGSSTGFIAVRVTPESYPAKLDIARFFIWDETTYPFELHVWDDSGISGSPGSDLMTPMVVDPVAPSTAENINWFDIELAEQNIIINSGDVYIGWRQIGSDKNQVGFDTNSTNYQRTWGYLPGLGGWFNLYELHLTCLVFPILCDSLPNINGNIMIRGITSTPNVFSGTLPESPINTPLYSHQMHPVTCPDMNPTETCQQVFEVFAVGAVSEKTKIEGLYQSATSFDHTNTLNVTIMSALSACQSANLDGIGRVDIRDFAIISSEWLENSGSLQTDLNSDQAVNLGDLELFSQYWLAICP